MMSTPVNFMNGIFFPPNVGPMGGGNYVITQAQHQVSTPGPGLTSHGGAQQQQQHFQASPSFVPPTSPSPPTPKEKEAQVLPWDEFRKLLPDDLAIAPERPQPGSLPDARFYTPKNPRKDHYLVFPSKADYIANFVHYYFSMNNLSRDKTLQDLMAGTGSVPLRNLLYFPKLSQVDTSSQDLVAALTDSFKVKVVTMADGELGVMRKDEWSPFKSVTSGWQQQDNQPNTISPSAASTASTVSPLPPPTAPPQQPPQQHYFPTTVYAAAPFGYTSIQPAYAAAAAANGNPGGTGGGAAYQLDNPHTAQFISASHYGGGASGPQLTFHPIMSAHPFWDNGAAAYHSGYPMAVHSYWPHN